VGTLIRFAEEQFGLTRLVGRCIGSNSASARVLEKSGFSLEGRQAKHILHEGQYEDMLLFGRCSAGRDAA
jgi:[ribosomal protein S5]-alanine N-acetyltransferase